MSRQKRRAANTATGAALIKALEAYTPARERLFDDAVIGRLLPAPARALSRVGVARSWFARTIERSNPGLFGGMVCRTRALDDLARQAVHEGAHAVVVLGAGLDTRAYRMPELAALPVFEVDQPAVIATKRAALDRNGVRRDHVTFVALDFETADVASRLRDAGWDADGRTLFLWEGVTQYVARDAVRSMFLWIASAASGSTVAFTYVPRDVIEGRSTRRGLESARRFVKRGLWVTGFDPATLRDDLAAVGLELIVDLGVDEYRARYLAPVGRRLDVFEIERVAAARVARAP